jgi:hypothetical protein
MRSLWQKERHLQWKDLKVTEENKITTDQQLYTTKISRILERKGHSFVVLEISFCYKKPMIVLKKLVF